MQRPLSYLPNTRGSKKKKKITMAPAEAGRALSTKRAQFAGPAGMKGIFKNGKTSAIATFAALGGFVYGCENSTPSKHWGTH